MTNAQFKSVANNPFRKIGERHRCGNAEIDLYDLHLKTMRHYTVFMTSDETAKFTEALYLIEQAHTLAKDATYLSRKSAFLSKKAAKIISVMWATMEKEKRTK